MDFLLAIILAVIVIYSIMTYNSLVNISNNVAKAWANIDVLLKQRNEELPKLIDTCKAYMQHESSTLENVIRARMGIDAVRQTQDVAGLNRAESSLHSSLVNLYAVAENYPELKADQSFNNLQQRITGLENQIADRREFYNDSVNINNVRIEQFPDLIVARVFNFQQKEMLQFAPEELEDINVGSRFNS